MKKIYLSLIALFCAINFSYAQWSTLGSDIYYNTGNVGIGTGPTSRLTVSGGGATFGQYSTTVNNDGVLSIGDATNNFTPTASNWNTTGSNLIFNGGGYSTIAFWNADNRVDFIRTGNRTIQLGYDGGWGTANVGFTNGIWDINGNVGIGTTTPLSPLHVNGDIRISAGSGGQLIFADGSTMSSASLGSAASLSNPTNAIITSNSGGGGTGDIILKTASAERLRVLNSNGNVGIGTTSPTAGLDIADVTNGNYNFRVTGGYTNFSSNILRSTYGTSGHLWDVIYGDVTRFNYYDGATFSTDRITFDNSGNFTAAGNLTVSGTGYNTIAGNVAIGTTDPQGHKLAVNGDIIATAVTVKLHANWPDYVFKPQYHLPSLSSVKSYIDQNQHLPDMPSEQEVVKNGINLGEIVKLQTKKIEELTLYLIDKDKQLTDQQKQIDILKQQNARIAALEEAISKLTTNK